ncbi:MAG TPA: hypothetical protein VNO26_03720 [Candidatus Limnocylindria bacterium]|nr:hypothetical protein [Candidatus Limnocylindria bacterium]
MRWLAVVLAFASVALAHSEAPALRSSPLQVDADGFVFVVNPDSDSVTRLTPLSGGVQTKQWETPVGDYPRTLTLAGSAIFTADQDSDTVSRLDKASGALTGTYELPPGCAPYGITANQDTTRLYVTCQGTGELIVLQPDLTLVATVKLRWPTPRAVLVSGDDTRVYVSHFITAEPNHDARVSEIDATTNALTERGELVIPVDRTTCETQNSGQGVFNALNALAMTPPGSPPEVANQLWVGGILQNVLTKGLFRRHAGFRNRPEVALFQVPCPDDPQIACLFDSFPRDVRGVSGAKTRNVFKSSFHDIIRSAIWKIDLATGAVVGKIDIDEGSQATDIVFSDDGTTAYVVDQMFHSYHVFNTRRGQDGNPATVFAGVSRFGPFGADPSQPCGSDALNSVTSERPHRLPPQTQIVAIDAGDPIRVTKAVPTVGTAVPTGVDFDTRLYHQTGAAQMRAVPDAIGTAPIGIGLSPDGCIAYVANYLGRNVVAVAAKSSPACAEYDPIVDFRCSGDITQSCQTSNDCSGGTGFCNHPGGPPCSQDSDCVNEPCIRDNVCIPLIASTTPAATTDLVSDEVPAEILDGKILFNTAARDASVPNAVGLGQAAPLFNDVRRGCGYDINRACRSDLGCSFCADQDPLSSPPTCVSNADCGGQRCVLADKYCSNDPSLDCDSDTDCGGGQCVSAFCDQVASLPGEIVSTAHDASYVTCTTCHLDYGGQDGRTWDFSQLGASLRNTMDLRGRSQAAPGTCAALLAADPGKVGATCHFDAECGSGSAPGACVADPSMIPPHLTGPDRARYFNPMVTVHWNGDRMEVEGFEFTYRSLLAAGDCDGAEHDPEKCMGALIPRSLQISTATVPFAAGFEGDLQQTLRNIPIEEPTLGKTVNASVRLSHMADFTYSLTKFPKNPNLGADGASPSEAAQRGRLLFNDESTGCASCHNGPGAGRQLFTDKRPNPSFVPNEPPGAVSNNPYVRHAVGTENLFDATDPDDVADLDGARQNSVIPIPASRGPLAEYVTPVLNDVWNTPPFLHDGSAPTLLDVVRPCSRTLTDCNQPGLGRNVDEKHGKTAHLTPQQLNDLVAFQKAPHGPVGSSGSTIKAGGFAVSKMLVNFGKKPGKASFTVTGTASPGSFPMDPSAGGLTFTLAVPAGEEMAMLAVAADAASVKVAGDGKRIAYKAKAPVPEIGSISVSLKQQRSGSYKVVVKGKKVDASSLRNGARDVTAALTVGTTQFVQNRVLTAKKGGRLLALAN